MTIPFHDVDWRLCRAGGRRLCEKTMQQEPWQIEAPKIEVTIPFHDGT